MILFTPSKPILEYTTQRERWIETWRRGISCIRLSPIQWNRKRRSLYENKSSCGGGTPLPLSDQLADHFTGDKRERDRLSQRQGLKDRGQYERMVATTIKSDTDNAGQRADLEAKRRGRRQEEVEIDAGGGKGQGRWCTVRAGERAAPRSPGRSPDPPGPAHPRPPSPSSSVHASGGRVAWGRAAANPMCTARGTDKGAPTSA